MLLAYVRETGLFIANHTSNPEYFMCGYFVLYRQKLQKLPEIQKKMN